MASTTDQNAPGGSGPPASDSLAVSVAAVPSVQVSQPVTPAFPSSAGVFPVPVSTPLMPSNNGGQTAQSMPFASPTLGGSVATNSPAQQTPKPSSSSSKGGVATGAVIGVAVGMLIVGAAIAFIIAFFVFKKRNRQQSRGVGDREYVKYAESTPELVMMHQKSLGLSAESTAYYQIPRSAPSPLPPAAQQQVNSSDLNSFLPPPAHRDEIQRRVLALFRQIHRHIETYYRDVHASITPSMEPELARFGANSINVAHVLSHCSQPTMVLKHALAAYVLSITGPKNQHSGDTLFPEELNSIRTQRGGNSISDPSLTQATNLHRRLSVYLYTSSLTAAESRASWFSMSDIREASEHFSLTFFPWANPISSDQEKEEDLANIISVALEIRTWLYGQPSEYDFIWEVTDGRTIIVNPALQRIDEGASGSDTIIESTVAGL